jgi:hypothetical protein
MRHTTSCCAGDLSCCDVSGLDSSILFRFHGKNMPDPDGSAITACNRSRCFARWFVTAVLYHLKCTEKWRKTHEKKAQLPSTTEWTIFIQNWSEPNFLMTEAHPFDIESFIDLSHQSSMAFGATATYSCEIIKFSKDCCWGGIDEIWCHW